MDGTIGLSLQLAGAPATLRGRLKLQEGEILSLRVGESIAEDRFAITIRGVSLTVRSNIPLPSGSILHAKVVFSGNRIELKILEPAAAAPSMSPQGLSSGPARPSGAHDPATILLQAMQRTGLPVTTSSMNAITAMLPQERRNDPAFVRLATILYDKHLQLSPERLEELYLTINERSPGDSDSGAGSRHGASGGPGGQNPRRGADGARPSSAALQDEAAAGQGAPAASAEPGLAAGLRRRLSAQGMNAIGWPALVNHPIGEHESWVIVPFSFTAGETAVDGTIRLLIAPSAPRDVPAGSRLPILRAVVAVPEVGAFEITGAPPRGLKVYPESGEAKARISSLLPDLKEKLRNLGVEIDDTNNGGAVFDGFSAEMFEIRGVDATA